MTDPIKAAAEPSGEELLGLAAAIETCDWSGIAIGNKAILRKVVTDLRRLSAPAGNDGMRDALAQAREEIVLAIAFLGRDAGTDRLDGTIKGLTKRLAEADAAILAALSAPQPREAEEPGRPLANAEASFEFIRLKLVDCLNEPERSAFWKAVEARDAIRALKLLEDV